MSEFIDELVEKAEKAVNIFKDFDDDEVLLASNLDIIVKQTVIAVCDKALSKLDYTKYHAECNFDIESILMDLKDQCKENSDDT